MGLFRSDSDSQDGSQILSEFDDLSTISKEPAEGEVTSAEQLALRSEGNISKEDIVGLDTKYSLQSYLQSNEQPHYIFSHPSKGLIFEHPKLDEEETPFHSGFRGKRYLILTDSRILFIAGWPKNSDTGKNDTVIESPYSGIDDVVKFSGGIFSGSGIQFTTMSGLSVSFVIDGGSYKNMAVEYIKFQKENSENKKQGKERLSQETDQDQSTSQETDQDQSTSQETDQDQSTDVTDKQPIQEKLKSIRSDLAKVDSFNSNSQFQQAEQLLYDIESRLESLEQKATGRELDELKAEARNIEQEIRNRRAREEKKKEIEEELDSIRSDLSEIDSLIIDAEYQQAERIADEIKSDISSLKRKVSQENIDSLETKIQRLEQKNDKRLSKSHVLTQLREMDPYEFEKFVAKLWEKQGWDAQVTSGSTDRGVDVIALKEDAFEERRHLIQVKRHGENSKVGSEDIQRYAGLYARRDEEPDAVFVVTSNRFTKEAKEVAKNRDVRLVDCDELYEMLIET